jgi:steroid 5-alpha reductase family enzyme
MMLELSQRHHGKAAAPPPEIPKERGSAKRRALEVHRAPLVSHVIDALYGTIPAPSFILPNGELSPDHMMKNVPGAALVAMSVGVSASMVFAAAYLGSSELGVAAFLPVGVHWGLFLAHGLPQRSEKYFDLAGQLGFSLMLFYYATVRSAWASDRKTLVCAACFMWSFRLGYFLFMRMLERGDDWRFAKARNYPGFLFFTWTSQGIWCFLQGLSVLMLLDAEPGLPVFTMSDAAGLTVWAFGLIVETLADQQKLAFVRRYDGLPYRPQIMEGLWAWSRHPNFFGETTCWVGMFIMCWMGLASSAWSADEALYRCCVAAFAPLWSFVFLHQTTLPWLEVNADRRHGHDSNYVEYKERTSAYILLPKRPTWL